MLATSRVAVRLGHFARSRDSSPACAERGVQQSCICLGPIHVRRHEWRTPKYSWDAPLREPASATSARRPYWGRRRLAKAARRPLQRGKVARSTLLPRLALNDEGPIRELSSQKYRPPLCQRNRLPGHANAEPPVGCCNCRSKQRKFINASSIARLSSMEALL